jgi:hypothetical protein
VEEISYTLTSGLMLLWKSMYLANLTVLTDISNEGSGIYQKGIVLRIQRPETDIKDRTNLHESETALDLFQFTGIINNTKDLPYLLDLKEYLNNK